MTLIGKTPRQLDSVLLADGAHLLGRECGSAAGADDIHADGLAVLGDNSHDAARSSGCGESNCAGFPRVDDSDRL